MKLTGNITTADRKNLHLAADSARPTQISAALTAVIDAMQTAEDFNQPINKVQLRQCIEIALHSAPTKDDYVLVNSL